MKKKKKKKDQPFLFDTSGRSIAFFLSSFISLIKMMPTWIFTGKKKRFDANINNKYNCKEIFRISIRNKKRKKDIS